MNQKIKVLSLLLLLMMAFTTVSLGQSRKYKKLQYELSYAHYEKTWYGEALSELKEAKGDTKKSVSNSKKSTRRAGKLNKLRTDISQIAARKEGNDE